MSYIVKKIITLILTVLVISFLTFWAFSVIPGDAAQSRLGTDATPEQIEALREEMGLNDPVPVRFWNWLRKAVTGDFGQSYTYSGISVKELLSSRFPVTILLAAMSFVLIVGISIPLSLVCAYSKHHVVKNVIDALTQVTMAIPSFFLGILLTLIFSLILHWFQTGSFVSPSEDLGASLKYLVYPAVTVALPKIAMTVKFLNSSIEEEMKQDYVRTSLSQGSSRKRAIRRHVLRNAMIPVITFLALIVAEIMAGSIVAEQVFNVPGIGRLLISSISSRDYPVVQAIVVYLTSVVVIINTLVDILYQLIDPRVRVR